MDDGGPIGAMVLTTGSPMAWSTGTHIGDAFTVRLTAADMAMEPIASVQNLSAAVACLIGLFALTSADALMTLANGAGTE